MTLALSLTLLSVNAVPAKPGVVKVKMANGNMVDATIVGDEYWHCMVDEAGDVITENDNGLYEKSNVSLRDIDVRAKMMAARRSRPAARKPMNTSAFTRGIVILVSFSDKTFSKTRASFDSMLNDTTGDVNQERGSAKQYFMNSSFGAFVPQFDVYGPYTLDGNCAYYGRNDGGSGSDSRPGQMVVDAVAAYIEQYGENALRQYDCDGDGYVDNIFVFYAGHGENAGGGANCIWPHRSYIYPGWVDGRTNYGGVELGDYACSCELQGPSGSTMSGIGPFCHEFSHVLGLPDMYDTWYSGHRTCGDWDVMDAGNYLNGEHTPPAYSSYERFYLGWLTPEILRESDNVTLEALNGSNTAKIITSTCNHNLNGGNPNPEEFFMLEVRNDKGWDSYLPGHGMLITKVRYDYYKWAYNEVNNDASDMGVDIIEAAGVRGYTSSDSDPFPGSQNVTSYTPYDGQPITDIMFNRDNVTFKYKGGREKFNVSFDGMGHGTPAVDDIMESVKNEGVILPAVQNVDGDYTFEGWSESSSASVADAGNTGERYYPDTDIRLFAVYRHNGEIEPTETGCITETFDKCNGRYDIGDRMDRYTDLPGWYGQSVQTTTGAVVVGSNSVKGRLVSPRLHLSGDMTVEVTCKALADTYMMVSSENGNVDTAVIGMEYQTYTFEVGAVPMDSRLTFSCDENIFYIDSVEFCGAKKSPVEDVVEGQYLLVRSMDGVIVAGLNGGEHVRLLDVLGRVVDERVAEREEISFIVGKGLYMVQIIDGKNVTVLK